MTKRQKVKATEKAVVRAAMRVWRYRGCKKWYHMGELATDNNLPHPRDMLDNACARLAKLRGKT